MTKHSITHHFATPEELQEHINLISGATAGAAESKTKGKGKTAEVKAQAGAQTAAGLDKPSAPAAVAPTVDQLKAHILKHHKSGATPEGQKLTMDFVAKHGQKKISDMTDAQRTAAFGDVEDYFGESASNPSDDPMA